VQKFLRLSQHISVGPILGPTENRMPSAKTMFLKILNNIFENFAKTY